ncbi:MAG: glycosyltransferase family 39 protein [Thermoleophilaceae bacterium]
MAAIASALRTREVRVLLAITALAGLLRFATLDAQSFWLDEAVTVDVLDRGFGAMLDVIPRSESTPPLYYVLAWLWTKAFGLGEVGLRSFSAVCGTAAVPVCWAAARELFGARAACATALLAAVSPFLVWYSQEGRAYALLVLAGGLSVWLTARLIRAPRRRDAVLWVLAALATVTTHYFGAFVIAAEAMALLVLAPRRLALAAAGTALVGGLVLLPLALDQRAAGFADYIASASLARRVEQVPKQLTLGFDAPLEVLTSVLACSLAGLGVTVALLRPEAAWRRTRWVALALGAGGVLGPLALALAGSDYVITRNLILAWIPLASLAAAGLTSRFAGRAGLGALGVVAALGLLASLSVPLERSFQRENWREAAQRVGPPGARAVLVSGASQARAVELYRPRARPDSGIPTVATEVVALSRRGRDLGGYVPTGPDPATMRATGLRVVETRHEPTYELVRLRPVSGRPVTLDAQQLSSLGLARERGSSAVLVEPAAGR